MNPIAICRFRNYRTCTLGLELTGTGAADEARETVLTGMDGDRG